MGPWAPPIFVAGEWSSQGRKSWPKCACYRRFHDLCSFCMNNCIYFIKENICNEKQYKSGKKYKMHILARIFAPARIILRQTKNVKCRKLRTISKNHDKSITCTFWRGGSPLWGSFSIKKTDGAHGPMGPWAPWAHGPIILYCIILIYIYIYVYIYIIILYYIILYYIILYYIILYYNIILYDIILYII